MPFYRDFFKLLLFPFIYTYTTTILFLTHISSLLRYTLSLILPPFLFRAFVPRIDHFAPHAYCERKGFEGWYTRIETVGDGDGDEGGDSIVILFSAVPSAVGKSPKANFLHFSLHPSSSSSSSVHSAFEGSSSSTNESVPYDVTSSTSKSSSKFKSKFKNNSNSTKLGPLTIDLFPQSISTHRIGSPTSSDGIQPFQVRSDEYGWMLVNRDSHSYSLTLPDPAPSPSVGPPPGSGSSAEPSETESYSWASAASFSPGSLSDSSYGGSSSSSPPTPPTPTTPTTPPTPSTSTLEISIRITHRVPLSSTDPLSAPLGPAIHLDTLIPLHWHVLCTSSLAEIEIKRGGKVVYKTKGTAHTEKSWGRSNGFPKGWAWLQGHSALPSSAEANASVVQNGWSPSSLSSITCAGGLIQHPFIPSILSPDLLKAYMIIYRSPSISWTFAPPWTLMSSLGFGSYMAERLDKDGENKRMILDVRSLLGTKRLVVRVQGPGESSEWTPFHGPTSTEHKEMSIQAFEARVEVEAYRRSIWRIGIGSRGGWERVEKRVFERSAFELGGCYRPKSLLEGKGGN